MGESKKGSRGRHADDACDWGVIGGTGLEVMDALRQPARIAIETPYGTPSSDVVVGELGGSQVAFLSRHGEEHALAPHQINYRANMYALSRFTKSVVAVAAVGSIDPVLDSGELVVPNQIIDYTWGREHTYSGMLPGDEVSEELLGDVLHVDFGEPYDASLRRQLLEAAAAAGVTVHDGGVYGATQGPRLESAAEIDRLERDGCTIVGMTGMPETALARELGLAYACCAVVVNPAAGRGEGEITLELIRGHLNTGMVSVNAVLLAMAGVSGSCATPSDM